MSQKSDATQKNKVFIAYAEEDYQKALRLYNDLKNANLNPWLDKKDLHPGQNWKLVIKNVIRNSRYFIALLSSISVRKIGEVQDELYFALEVFRTFPPEKIFAIPVRLDDCEIPYEELRHIHYVDLFPSDNDWKEGVNQIIEPLGEEHQQMKPRLQSKRSLKLYSPKPTAVTQMQITKIVPNKAPVGERISIFGSNFGKRHDTSIWFGNTKAKEYRWQDQRIDVEVPYLDSDYCKITIIKGGESTTSKKNFVIEW